MTTTHPMEYPDTGLPVSADRMRQRVAALIGDPTRAEQVLAEMAHWATRCAEVKHDGGDGLGSDKALWMRAVLAPVEDDPYADNDEETL